MLKVNHIVKHFDNLTALDIISLTILDRESYGLLGAIGAGKSTLMFSSGHQQTGEFQWYRNQFICTSFYCVSN